MAGTCRKATSNKQAEPATSSVRPLEAMLGIPLIVPGQRDNVGRARDVGALKDSRPRAHHRWRRTAQKAGIRARVHPDVRVEERDDFE